MADDKKIGSAYFEVEARVKQAEQELDKLQQKGKETAQELDKSGSEMGKKLEDSATKVTQTSTKMVDDTTSANKKVGKSFSDTTLEIQSNVSRQVGAITGLIGAFTAVVGVGTIFYNIGKKIGGMLFDTTPQVEKYRRELEKLPKAYSDLSGDASTKLGNSLEEIATRSSRVANAIRALNNSFGGDDLSGALERYGQIQDKFNEIAAKAAANGGEYEENWLQIFGLTDRTQISSVQDAIDKLATAEEKAILARGENLKRLAAQQLDIEKSNQITDSVVEFLGKQADAARDAAKATENANNNARTLIKSTGEVFDQSPRDEISAIYKELDNRIAQLDEAMKNADDSTRAALIQAKRQAIEDADALATEFENKRDDKRRQSIESEIQAIRRETLGPLQREIEATQQRQEEIRKLLGDGIDDDLEAALVAALGERLDRLLKQQEVTAKEMPEKIGKAVEDGMRRVIETTGILGMAPTLSAINTNSLLIYQEAQRLGN